MLGMEQEQADAAALAAFGGITVAKAIYGLIGPEGAGSLGSYALSIGVGGLVAFGILAAMWKTEKKI